MPQSLLLDTETYSELPLRNGLYAYAAACEVMIVTYAIDDGPVQVWEPDLARMPGDLFNALFRSDCTVTAHNAMFDRNVLRLGNLKIEIPISRWRCTMAQAMAHSLPGKLDTLCQIFNVGADDAKIEGRNFVHLFCKPGAKNAKLRRATRETHPKEWAEFLVYATHDVKALRQLVRKLPTWNYKDDELALYHLDQTINDRGVAVDLEFSRAALDSIERVQAKLAADTMNATDGEVSSTTRRDQLLKHILAEHGVALPDLKASTLGRRLNDENLPDVVRELILMRLEASQTSGKKHKALLRGASADGRLRGLLRYCGASRTGRWSGQLFQPQNLTRPAPYIAKGYDEAIEVIKGGAVDLVYDKPLEVISGTVRGALVAPPGRKLVIADLAAIEGRVLAWLAGEQWKLDAYTAGEDMYKVAYSKSFGIPLADVTKDQRQIGKVQELALGYQGAVGAVRAMAGDKADAWTDEFIVGTIVKPWRKANQRIATFWYEMEDTVRVALDNRGESFECRRLSVRYNGAWLGVKLPSGRTLCYPRPRLNTKGKVAYDGVNQYTRKWGEIPTYGGKLVENVTQAVARDVMASAMPDVEASGFEIVLSVHDELVTEAPDANEFSAARLSDILAYGATWTEGLPLDAAGFETYRYRKE